MMDSTNYSVSVIIPTYNRKSKLIRAIKSAIDQTNKPNEIIIVDDNSSFDVKNFLEKEINYKLKIIQKSYNSGPSESRNIGASIAKGDLIAFLDSDDYWDKSKIQQQVKIFKNTPIIGMVYCNMYIVKSKGSVINSSKKIINNNILYHLVNWWTAPNTSTLMFRRDVFNGIGGFDETLFNCEDHDLWFKIAENYIVVKGLDKNLSFFSQENHPRLSLDYKKRFLGMKRFLKKWKSLIIDIHGSEHYKWFSDKYKVEAAFPIFILQIKRFRVLAAFIILFKYLINNPLFYNKIYRIFNKFTKKY